MTQAEGIQMPTWSEFWAGFGVKEIIITLLIVLSIVAFRESRHIFRRKKDAAKNP